MLRNRSHERHRYLVARRGVILLQSHARRRACTHTYARLKAINEITRQNAARRIQVDKWHVFGCGSMQEMQLVWVAVSVGMCTHTTHAQHRLNVSVAAV